MEWRRVRGVIRTAVCGGGTQPAEHAAERALAHGGCG
jgi:hypothetical protein